MQAEAATVSSEPEALAFAWGCFCAALAHGFMVSRIALAQAHNAGVVACSTAVLMGCAFMYRAGAPSHYLWMNLLSLVFAVVAFRMLPRRRFQADELLRAKLSFALGGLLLIASLGQAPTGAEGWLRIGPVILNLPWLLLPALLVASDVRWASAARPWALGGLLMGCAALALMADAVLMVLAAAVLSLRAWHRRSGALAGLASATWALAAVLCQRWQAPQALAFVDLVLQSGFRQNWAMGLALTLLQTLPLWPALRHRHARVLGIVWGLLLALSLPGWLPSPMVGFGGSFILAYLLSLALLAGDTVEHVDAGPCPPSSVPGGPHRPDAAPA